MNLARDMLCPVFSKIRPELNEVKRIPRLGAGEDRAVVAGRDQVLEQLDGFLGLAEEGDLDQVATRLLARLEPLPGLWWKSDSRRTA